MPYFLLILTVLFWAGNFVTARGIHAEFPPLTMSFMRWGLALLIILPFVLPRILRRWPLIRQHLPILVVLSVLSVVCFNSFIYLGVQTTQATNATLMQSAVPIIILVFTSVFLGETVVRRQWFGVFISLAGVLMLVAKGDPEILLTLSFNTGDLWILAAVLSWSAYSVMLRLKPVELDGFTFFWCYCGDRSAGAVSIYAVGISCRCASAVEPADTFSDHLHGEDRKSVV